MPILKLIRYKSGTDFRPSVMRNVIGYCLQPSKTKIREEIFSVTGQNCVPAIAYNQFMATKASWGKTDAMTAEQVRDHVVACGSEIYNKVLNLLTQPLSDEQRPPEGVR